MTRTHSIHETARSGVQSCSFGPIPEAASVPAQCAASPSLSITAATSSRRRDVSRADHSHDVATLPAKSSPGPVRVREARAAQGWGDDQSADARLIAQYQRLALLYAVRHARKAHRPTADLMRRLRDATAVAL